MNTEIINRINNPSISEILVTNNAEILFEVFTLSFSNTGNESSPIPAGIMCTKKLCMK